MLESSAKCLDLGHLKPGATIMECSMCPGSKCSDCISTCSHCKNKVCVTHMLQCLCGEMHVCLQCSKGKTCNGCNDTMCVRKRFNDEGYCESCTTPCNHCSERKISSTMRNCTKCSKLVCRTCDTDRCFCGSFEVCPKVRNVYYDPEDSDYKYTEHPSFSIAKIKDGDGYKEVVACSYYCRVSSNWCPGCGEYGTHIGKYCYKCQKGCDICNETMFRNGTPCNVCKKVCCDSCIDSGICKMHEDLMSICDNCGGSKIVLDKCSTGLHTCCNECCYRCKPCKVLFHGRCIYKSVQHDYLCNNTCRRDERFCQKHQKQLYGKYMCRYLTVSENGEKADECREYITTGDFCDQHSH